MDELIVTAGKSLDQPAVDDLNEQNGHNRAKRRQLALDDLEADFMPAGHQDHRLRTQIPSRAFSSFSHR